MSHPNHAADVAAATTIVRGEFLVPNVLVAPIRLTAANWAKRWATEKLGGRREPDLKVYSKSPDSGHVIGATTLYGAAIFVQNGLSVLETVNTSAHETGHTNGIVDEGECRAIGKQAEHDWTQRRFEQRDALAASWKAARARWFAATGNNAQRAKALCEIMGVLPLQPALALEELQLRTLELEQMGAAPPGSAVAHLTIRRAKPPATSYSFARGNSR